MQAPSHVLLNDSRVTVELLSYHPGWHQSPTVDLALLCAFLAGLFEVEMDFNMLSSW